MNPNNSQVDSDPKSVLERAIAQKEREIAGTVKQIALWKRALAVLSGNAQDGERGEASPAQEFRVPQVDAGDSMVLIVEKIIRENGAQPMRLVDIIATMQRVARFAKRDTKKLRNAMYGSLRESKRLRFVPPAQFGLAENGEKAQASMLEGQ